MTVTNESLEWDSEDMANWRAFLKTRAGQRLLPKLIEHAPILLASGATNDILIRTGEVRGWAEAARTLLALQVPPPVVQTVESYPDPMDDSKWDDGQKISTP